MKNKIRSFALPLLLMLGLPTAANASTRVLWVNVEGAAAVDDGANQTRADQYQSSGKDINAFRASVSDADGESAPSQLTLLFEDETGIVSDARFNTGAVDFSVSGAEWVPFDLAANDDGDQIVTLELGHVDWAAYNAAYDAEDSSTWEVPFDPLAAATETLGNLADAPHVSVQADLNPPALTPWTPDLYTVTAWTISYVMDGGTNNPANPTEYNAASTLPIALLDPEAREGYTFGGWTDENGDAASEVEVGSTGDRTFTATWLVNVAVPVIDSKTYTAALQTATVPASAGYGVAANAGGSDAGDYTVTLALNEGYAWSDGTTADKTVGWSIVPATLTVAADAQTKTYGTADPALTYTASGLLGSDAISGELGRDAGENVGTYAINQGTLSAGSNYTLAYTGANLEIVPATAVIPAAATDLVYDGTLQTGVSGGTGYAISGNTGTAAGDYAATLTLAANYKWSDNTTTATKTIPWSIAPKAVTITVADSSKVYGEADSAFTGTVDGLVNDGDLGTVAYSRTNAEEDVGSYADVLTATYTANANYSVTVVPGDFEITAKAVTITVADSSKVYGEADPAFTGAVTGLVDEGDLGTITYSRTGADEDVGTYDDVLTASYTANANYSVTVVPGDFEITAKAVTITVADASKVYGEVDPAFTGTVDGLVDDGDLGTVAYSRTNAAEDVGTYDDVLTATYTANANYSVTVVPGDFEITAKAVTITVADASKVYGEADPDFTGTVAGLLNDSDLGTVAYSRSNADEDVGTYAGVLTATYTTNANYSVTVVPGDFEITAKVVTITVADATKVYGEADPAFTGTVEGLVDDSDLGTVAYSRTNADEDVGTYADVLTATYTANANYSVTVVSGDFEITAKAVTITVADASKVYGEADPAFTGAVTGLVDEGDLGTITYSRTGADEDVGTYDDVLTASYTANANYSVTVVPGDFEITAKTVTITVADASKVYGEADPTFSGTVAGLVNEDDLGTVTYSRTGADEDVGSYADALTASYTANANYSVTVVPGDFEITAKAVTITVVDASKVYGEADPAFTGTVEGLVDDGDLGTVAYSRTNAADDVGSYDDVLTATYTANSNYSVTVVPGDFEITAKAVTITVADASKVYGEADPTFTGTVEGLVDDGDLGTVAYSRSNADEDVGSYADVLTATYTANANYSVTVVPGDFEITAKAVTITVADASKVYGEADPAFTGTVEGLVDDGDLGTVAYSRTNAAEDVGIYDGVLTATYTANANYNVTVVPGDFEITAKAVTITVADASKVYGEADPAFTGAVTGLVNEGDLGTVTYSRTGADEDVGTYADVLRVSYTANANYSVTVIPGDFEITVKAVTITVADSSKVYGETDPAFTGTVDGLVNDGDLGTVACSRTNADEDVGTYDDVLTATYTANANYSVTVVPGDFEITAKAVTITVADASKIYGEADPAFTGTVEGLVDDGDLGTVAYSRTNAAEDVGTYDGVLTATYTANANYSVTVVPGDFEITTKAVTITVADASKVYGEADPTFTGTVDGLVDEGDLGTVAYSRTNADEDVGTYDDVLTATYTANANYSVTVVPGNFEITAKAVTITVSDASKVYGEADPVFTGTVDGLVDDGDLGTVAYSRTNAAEDVGTYDEVLTASYTANANYSVTVVPGGFEITAKAVTITVADASKVYGEADPVFTGTVDGLVDDGDLGTVAYSRTNADEDVGTYDDVLTATYTANANYSVTVVPGDFEITAKAVTITVADASKVYGEADPAFTGTVEGLVDDSDLGTVAYSRTNAAEDVGTYDDVLAVTYTANANYSVTVVPGDFEITAKAVTITVADASKVYGEEDPAFTGTVDGLVDDGDLGTVAYSRSNADEDVGAYADVLTATYTANANYTVTVVPGDFEITAKAVTITVADSSKVYGEADPMFTGTVTGLVDEDDLGTITYSRTGADEDVGSYADVLTASYTANANYSVTVVPGDFEITAKAVTITVADASKVYGEADPAFTGTVEGLVDDSDLGTVAYSRTNAAEDVGTYDDVLTATYTANANYNVTVVPGDFEITTKTVTITVADAVKVYGEADPAFTGTVDGLVDDGDLGTVAYSRTNADEDVGTYDGVLTATYTANANYSVTVVPGDFAISAKAVTITVADASKVYGEADPAFSGTVTGLVDEGDLGTIIYRRTGADEDVGTYDDVLTASYTANANYSVTVVPGDFEITAKTVTITVADASKVYGEADPAFTGTVDGLIDDGDLGTVAYSRTNADEDVGTYDGVLTATYTTNANYSVTVVPGDFEITAKAVTITVADASKVYGEDDPVFTGAVDGLVDDGDLGTVAYSRTNAAEDVGTYDDVLTATYTANANYSVTVVPGDFEITTKTVTITVADAAKVYGEADPAFTGTVDGLVDDGDLGTVAYSRTNSEENVGTYDDVLTATYMANANYSVTVVPGDFEITAKAVAITVADASKAYGEADPVFTGTVDGLVDDGDLGTVAYSRTNADEDVGTYDGVLTATYTANANYTVTVVPGDFAITAKAVTITVADASKVYGEADPAFTGTVDGLVDDGDLGTVAYSRTNADEDVGTYDGVLTATYAANANYSVTVVPGDFAISAKAVTITVADASKVYGEADPVFTGTVDGLVNDGDLGTVAYSRTNSDEDVGTYDGVLTATYTANSNYSVTVAPGDFEITAKAVTITVADASKVYGEADPVFTGTVDGLVDDGDLGAVAYSRTNSDEDVGTYDDVLTATYTANANYSVTVVPGDFEITAKAVTITVADASKAYGEADPAFSGTVTGLVDEGDLGTIIYRRTGADEDVGTYDDVLTASYTANANYSVTVVPGDFEITAKAVTITVADASKVYGEDDPVFTGAVDGLVDDGDLGTVAYSRTNAAEDVGTYDDVLTATYTANANYSVTVVPGDFEITTKTVTITVADAAKVYGEADPAFTGTVDGLVDDGDLGAVAYSRTNSDEDVGTYDDVLTATYTANANYSVTVVPGDFEITAKAVTITVADASKVYGEADPVFTGTVDGLVDDGDLGTVAYSRTNADEDVGTYDGVLTATYTANANYSVTVVPGDFEITAKAVTITVVDASKVYGEADPAFTGTVDGLVDDGDLGTVAYSRTNSEENVGTYDGVLTATYTANANYSVTVVPGDFEITAKAVTITVVDASKVYGEADPAFTGTVEGLVDDGDLGTVAYRRTNADEDVGTYDDVLTATYTANANYSVTVVPGDFEIAAKAVTITVADASKVYGEADPAFTGTVDGLVDDGDLGTVAYSRTNVDEDVGSYDGVLTATYTENANYAVTVVPGDFAITAMTVTVTVNATSGSLEYDGTEQSFTPVLSYVSDEAGTALFDATNVAFSGTATLARTDVGMTEQGLAAGQFGYTDGNLAVAFVVGQDGALTITPKAVTVTADDKAKVAGNADPELTATVAGLVGSDTVVYTVGREAGEEVGTYTITPVGATEQGNYTVEYETGTFTIAGAVAAVVFEGTTTYFSTLSGAVASAVDGSTVLLLENLEIDTRVEPNLGEGTTLVIDLNGKTLTRSGTSGNGSAFDVKSGNVTITNGTIDCTQDDTAIVADGVYAITVRGGASATLADLDVTVDSKNGACAYPFSGATLAITSGNYANVTDQPYQYKAGWTGMAVNQANVVEALITITGGTFSQVDPKLGDDHAAEGTMNFVDADYWTVGGDGTWTVVPRIDIAEATVATVEGLVYDGEAQEGVTSVAYEGTELAIGTDYTLEYANNVNAGDGTAIAELTGLGLFKGTTNVAFSIARKAVTITVEDDAKVYGEADPAFEGTVEGLVSDGDLGTVAYRRTNDAVEDAGVYEDVLTADYTDNANYAVTVVPGDFEIAPKPVAVTVKATRDTRVFNGSEQSFTPVLSYISDEEGTVMFDASKVTFGGTATLTCTEVGTTRQGLADDQFVYADGNLDVVFEIAKDGALTIVSADEIALVGEWNDEKNWTDLTVMNAPPGAWVQILFTDDLTDSSSWAPLGEPVAADEAGLARFKDADQPGVFRAYRAKLNVRP